MIRCSHASELTSRALDGRLSVWQRVALRVHTWTCAGCRRYGDQLRSLHDAFRRLLGAAVPPGAGLSPESRERLRLAVRSRLDDDN